MKTISIVKYTFTLIGLAMLIGALCLYLNTRSFLGEALRTRGIVVDLVASQSDHSTTYAPTVQFKTPAGETIEFTSSTSSNPTAYNQGEIVEVLYLAGQPQGARINGFFSLWGGGVIVGSLGGIFFLVGAILFLVPVMSGRKEAYLRANGEAVLAQIQGVDRNGSLSVNGQNPFQVIARWQNPSTSEIHIFKSNNLWFDPTDFLKDPQVTVFIERGNPKKYHVDLSFLPKLAK